MCLSSVYIIIRLLYSYRGRRHQQLITTMVLTAYQRLWRRPRGKKTALGGAQPRESMTSREETSREETLYFWRYFDTNGSLLLCFRTNVPQKNVPEIKSLTSIRRCFPFSSKIDVEQLLFAVVLILMAVSHLKSCVSICQPLK